MRNTSARFSAQLGRLLILLLVVSMLATCFTGCFEYDPLGMEGESSGPAFDPDGDDEPDQSTDATTPTGSTESTEATDPSKSTEPSEATDPTQVTEATEPTDAPTEPATEPTNKPTTPPTYADPIAYGMVTADELNVRQGPGTNYNAVGKLYFNTRVAIYARNGTWGQTSEGWISLNYVYIDGQPGNVTDGAATITGDYVNIRQGPGTNYSILRDTRQGDKITILHIVKINNREWGCTSNGWICMDYVLLEKDKPAETEPPETTEATDPVETTEATEPETLDITGTWAKYSLESGTYQDSDGTSHTADGLRVITWVFNSNGILTYTSVFYIESEDGTLNYNSKTWKEVDHFGNNGNFTVSGTTLTTVFPVQATNETKTYTIAVSGSTLTIDGTAFTKA